MSERRERKWAKTCQATTAEDGGRRAADEDSLTYKAGRQEQKKDRYEVQGPGRRGQNHQTPLAMVRWDEPSARDGRHSPRDPTKATWILPVPALRAGGMLGRAAEQGRLISAGGHVLRLQACSSDQASRASTRYTKIGRPTERYTYTMQSCPLERDSEPASTPRWKQSMQRGMRVRRPTRAPRFPASSTCEALGLVCG